VTTVELPECLAHLPKHGHLPVPYFTGEVDGKWDFRTHNPQRHDLAMRFQLCGICGRHIAQPPYAFIFGPQSIDLLGSFMPPMHEQCALESMRLCPFLALHARDRSERGGNVAPMFERNELPAKPERFAMVLCSRYRTERGPSGLLYAFASKPVSTRWWAYEQGVLTPEAAA
jgi:hypothetical protein